MAAWLQAMPLSWWSQALATSRFRVTRTGSLRSSPHVLRYLRGGLFDQGPEAINVETRNRTYQRQGGHAFSSGAKDGRADRAYALVGQTARYGEFLAAHPG